MFPVYPTGLGLQTETHAPHRTRKRPADISSSAPCTDRAIPERTPLEPSLNVVIKTCPGRIARQTIEIPRSNHAALFSCGLVAVHRRLRIVIKEIDIRNEARAPEQIRSIQTPQSDRRVSYVIPGAWVDFDRLDSDQINTPLWFVIPYAEAIKRTSYVHSLVIVQKAPCSEHDFLAPGNDIPTGVRIVQIAAELDETFVSVGDVLVDSWSRVRSGELTESHSRKDACVISQAQVNISPSAAREEHLDFADRHPSYCWRGTETPSGSQARRLGTLFRSRSA